MRAWQVKRSGRPVEALERRGDVAAPEPAPGTVRLEVIAAGIGLPDALMCLGSYALTPGTAPFTPGQEVVGRIAGVGEGVEGREPGERVMALTRFFTGEGGFADVCLGLDDFCLPAPDEMSDAEAATFLIPFHTAYVALVRRGRLQPGETLLVTGAAGGTGMAALQLGRALGARVIAAAGGAEKAALCRELGAERVIDSRSDDLAAAVREVTDGRGADAVFDPVGGDVCEAAAGCIAPEGRLLAIGFASGSWGRVDTARLVAGNFSLVGVIPSHYDRSFRERAQSELIGWWREGKLRPRVEALVPFEELPTALERLLARGVTGKLALAVDPAATAPADAPAASANGPRPPVAC
jgi:NADPH2:quinone reductase